MDQDFADSAAIEGYHAHIYYAPETRDIAARLREGIGQRFTALLGRWHDEAVGPHPISMYQVAFAAAEFPRIVPWLMLNREGLSILVHPLSGDGYLDHAVFALWLGTPVPLRLDVLKRLIEQGRQV
ncbi:MAG TPA: DOPA 4,5-dioxygenase family protein [Stellaceae bacterium]|nr:DOPA 4,5-dioxygenase family protein [Stellaceae bacterium]